MSDAMEVLEAASEWPVPQKNGKPQKIFVEVFLSGGPLSIWRGVQVDISRTPGEAVSYAYSWERPHFVATETAAVPSSPTIGSRQRKEACCAAVSSRIRTESVKRVRIAHCTFRFSNLFTP
jgi:hypothetical protein